MQSLLPEQRRSTQERYTLFLMILMGVFLIQMWGVSKNQQKQLDQAQQQQKDQGAILDQPVIPKKDTEKKDSEEAEQNLVAETQVEADWLTLGSVDPESPYRMLVTLTNQGAAVARIELNTNKYRDVQEPSGYLGQIVVDTAASEKTTQTNGGGVTVQVVGHGTPAHKFGLMVGDRIIRFDRKIKATDSVETYLIKNFADLRNNLLKTRPGDMIDLTVMRDGRELSMTIVLSQHPMDIIRPESVPQDFEEYRQLGGLRGVTFSKDDTERSDQLSFLTTLGQVDQFRLDLPKSLGAKTAKQNSLIPRDATIDLEMPDVRLRREPWEIVSHSETEAVFRRTIPAWKLEMIKTYRLTKVEPIDGKMPSIATGYDFKFKIEIRNLDTKEHRVAYQLDGPTGLPLEGGWYALKSGPQWGHYGIRDLVVRFHGSPNRMVSNNVIAADAVDKPWVDEPLDYIGVDSRYFQCTLKPEKSKDDEIWLARSFPIRVGQWNGRWSILTDVSFRLVSQEKTLQPGEGPESRLVHEYTVFAGPKDTAILAEYDLGETISYGWFWFVAQPLIWVLHFFHSLGMTYAMAIVALTVCVRLFMFPISRKQALGAIKMAAIQPELKAINEKYKDDMQARSAATNAVFKKHNYHPMSGCLPLFIQLPIFIGLYKALSVDAGLYGSSLISPAIRWCNDLSAPDRLFDWSSFWNQVGLPGFNTGQGMFYLGPYFNLLPMLTIVLFLIQQAVMMPPPTDEQSRMQRKMMQYMMIFMGFLFFKVPSGLCVYFIISTLWGLAERRFIPKAPAPKAGEEVYDVEPDRPNRRDGNRDSNRDARSKDHKKPTKSKESAKPQEEGFFGKLMREVSEKAAEQRKLGKADNKDKGKKKR